MPGQVWASCGGAWDLLLLKKAAVRGNFATWTCLILRDEYEPINEGSLETLQESTIRNNCARVA